MWGVAGLEEELTLWRGVGTRLDDGSVGRGEGFVRSAGVGKGRLGQRGGRDGNPRKHLRHPTVTVLSPLRFYLDLFVGQLKSCLKCQACGYRSTTFEVFCDLSLPIPKVGFQRIPGVDGTWVL